MNNVELYLRIMKELNTREIFFLKMTDPPPESMWWLYAPKGENYIVIHKYFPEGKRTEVYFLTREDFARSFNDFMRNTVVRNVDLPPFKEPTEPGGQPG